MQKTYRSIFVSDVHLGTRDSQADKLNNFLKHNTCETLYLVGDILDVWRIQQTNGVGNKATLTWFVVYLDMPNVALE